MWRMVSGGGCGRWLVEKGVEEDVEKSVLE